MNMNALVRYHVEQRLNDDGVTVTNITKNNNFTALLSSSDLSASFMIEETGADEQVQGVILLENAPEHGDILLIENQKYIVKSVQKRITAKIARFYANLKIH